jgi:hypothetical protein
MRKVTYHLNIKMAKNDSAESLTIVLRAFLENAYHTASIFKTLVLPAPAIALTTIAAASSSSSDASKSGFGSLDMDADMSSA